MEIAESRLSNSARNFAFSLVGKVADILARFILRTIFIQSLATEYLGLGGLFSNILSFLSLAELGVGTAITFSLYEPIAYNQTQKIMRLMSVYRKAYMLIGLVILILGGALTPFLSLFIAEMPSVPYIEIIYLLFVLNSAISYFYSYKASFISANQKDYIVTNNTYFFRVLTAVVQGLVLFLAKDYILFLLIQLLFTVVSNIRISMLADRCYPILKERSSGCLDDKTKATISKNIRAMVLQKLGMTVVFSTDNLLLSKMFGLVVEGIYSNYSLLIGAAESILYQFFNAVAASIGNLSVGTDLLHQNKVFYRIFFINFWLYAVSAIAFGTLLSPFITLWIGKEFLLNEICTFLLVLNFYLKGIRNTSSTFDNSYGLMYYNRFVPIPECIINIVASIGLANVIGPSGIFLGTTLSTIATSLWREPYVLMKYGLKSSFFKYAKIFVFYFIVFVALWGMTHGLVIWLNASFIIAFLIVLIVPSLCILILFHHSDECRYFVQILGDLLRKRLK